MTLFGLKRWWESIPQPHFWPSAWVHFSCCLGFIMLCQMFARTVTTWFTRDGSGACPPVCMRHTDLAQLCWDILKGFPGLNQFGFALTAILAGLTRWMANICVTKATSPHDNRRITLSGYSVVLKHCRNYGKPKKLFEVFGNPEVVIRLALPAVQQYCCLNDTTIVGLLWICIDLTERRNCWAISEGWLCKLTIRSILWHQDIAGIPRNYWESLLAVHMQEAYNVSISYSRHFVT